MLVTGVNEFSEIEQFSVDWRKKFYGKPLAVLFPRDVNEVSCLITLVNRTAGLSVSYTHMTLPTILLV